MSRIVPGIVCLALLAGLQRAAAGDEVERTRAKLQAVQKQLKELRQQEQALVEQLAAQEAAQHSRPYIKAEVKGVLRYEIVYFPFPFSNPERPFAKTWTITVEDTKWLLDFGTNKAMLDRAKANEGKTVVVTGMVQTRVVFSPPANNAFANSPPPPAPPMGMTVATFKAAPK